MFSKWSDWQLELLWLTSLGSSYWCDDLARNKQSARSNTHSNNVLSLSLPRYINSAQSWARTAKGLGTGEIIFYFNVGWKTNYDKNLSPIVFFHTEIGINSVLFLFNLWKTERYCGYRQALKTKLYLKMFHADSSPLATSLIIFVPV